MKVVIDIPERMKELLDDPNSKIDWLDAAHIINCVQNGTPLVDVLTDFIEWQGLPFPNKNVFMNAPILIADTYLKEKNDADSN